MCLLLQQHLGHLLPKITTETIAKAKEMENYYEKLIYSKT